MLLTISIIAKKTLIPSFWLPFLNSALGGPFKVQGDYPDTKGTKKKYYS
jgi:hypothetical protein